jgi:hypothetical protein
MLAPCLDALPYGHPSRAVRRDAFPGAAGHRPALSLDGKSLPSPRDGYNANQAPSR